MSEFDLLGGAARGMGVQRALLDLAARNVAAAQASSPDHPYARLVADVAADTPDAEAGIPGDPDSADAADADVPLRTRSVAGSSDALTEMIAVLDAQRLYEQNASLFDTGKRIAERAIDLGRS